MGASIGAALRQRGMRVLWCSAGRSLETQRRAAGQGLFAVNTTRELVAASDVVLSVCPPHAALDVARSVAAEGFGGLYVDANAVSRGTVQLIENTVMGAGAAFVDAGILGPPVEHGRTTLLCLSGVRAPDVAVLFAGSALEPRIVGDSVGQASALKMAFAAWSKGSIALLAAARALAEAEGVGDALLESWKRLSPDVVERAERGLLSAAPKAWRWAGEMHEVAASFESVGLPGGFHQSAAALFERLAALGHEPQRVRDVLGQLLRR